MRYEMLTLTVRLGAAAAALAGVKANAERAGAKGKLMGCWSSEIGDPNRILVLRSFANDAGMQAERFELTADVNPFGAGEAIAELNFDSYAPFPWSTEPEPGKYGSVYEIRTYRLKHGAPAWLTGDMRSLIALPTSFSPLA
jgi:NIPSNAP